MPLGGEIFDKALSVIASFGSYGPRLVLNIEWRKMLIQRRPYFDFGMPSHGLFLS